MHRTTMLFLCLALLASFADHSNAEDVKKLTFEGKVVDSQGKLVTGAKVRFYEFVKVVTPFAYEIEVAKEITTKADGAFSFTKADDDEGFRSGMIVVEKEGLSIGWANWNRRKDESFEIKLRKPKELAGVVVDENDKLMADAEVSIFALVVEQDGKPQYLTRNAALNLFTTKTDKEGKFLFTGIPDEATADLLVSKPSRAIVSTWTTHRSPLSFKAGQKDIKLVLPVESKIEGIVVQKDTNKPIAGIQLMLLQAQNRPAVGHGPVVSNSDGTFTINALCAGTYFFQFIPSKEKMADWVMDIVEIKTQAGKTPTSVKIELSKGGVLEITIKGPEEKPVEKASVSIQREGRSQWLHCYSNEKGLARIRLLAGDYQIKGVRKEGYAGSRQQEAVTIQDNETVRKEVQLAQKPKINGLVRDEKGKPVEGASIGLYPMGPRDNIKTDAKGRFELDWDPGRWARMGERDTIHCLVVRYEGRNLAAAIEIEEDTKTLDVELEGGVVFYGVVVNEEEKPIEGAKINVMLRVSNWGSPITDWQKGGAITDSKGKFEVKAMPAGRKYNLIATGDGYGKSQVEALADDAEDDRLDVGRITLALANLTVSGLVVDSDDKPVSGANLYAHGDNQSDHHNLVTDADGKFVIEKVCAGKIGISAHTQGKTNLSGHVETEGGANDVKIVIAERSASNRFVPKQPKSLVGKSLPAFKGLDIKIDPNDIDSKAILVAFWDMQQRPSRHCMKELVKKAGELKEKNIVVIAVQASKVDQAELDERVKKYNIPFPTGMITDKEEKTKFKWGVKSLPWLILTDQKHIVSSNGFSLNELDEKIKQLNGE